MQLRGCRVWCKIGAGDFERRVRTAGRDLCEKLEFSEFEICDLRSTCSALGATVKDGQTATRGSSVVNFVATGQNCPAAAHVALLQSPKFRHVEVVVHLVLFGVAWSASDAEAAFRCMCVPH